MPEDSRVIIHVATLLTALGLVALGERELAAGLLVGATLPSPVSTLVRRVSGRRQSNGV